MGGIGSYECGKGMPKSSGGPKARRQKKAAQTFYKPQALDCTLGHVQVHRALRLPGIRGLGSSNGRELLKIKLPSVILCRGVE